jgi:hypothetical protein
MVVGIDQSVSSIALASLCYDHVMRKTSGPEFLMIRWEKDDHYFDRITEAGRSHEFIIELQAKHKIALDSDRIWIAQEEPFPPGSFVTRGISNSLKQQAEISGAMLSGFLRYGFKNIWQIGNHQWRQMLAEEFGITIHHSKWRDEKLAQMFQCRLEDSGKFRAKLWALGHGGLGNLEIPDWPDIIETKHGKRPRPDGSKARAVQADDRYEALAIMEFLRRDLVAQGVFK